MKNNYENNEPKDKYSRGVDGILKEREHEELKTSGHSEHRS